MRGVHHLRVILHPGQAARSRFSKAATGAPGGAGHHVESVRRGGDRVAVAHPDRLDLR